jgi:protocatechuate 3,4-dioxygenase beta subunit
VGLWNQLFGPSRIDPPHEAPLKKPRRKKRAAAAKENHSRHCRFEALEERRVMTADPIKVGVTYLEEDSGSDLHGDTFEILFEGGAEGTELTQLEINGDQGAAGYSVGDMIFDTIKGGYGADEAFPLQIISSTGIDSVTWQLTDGGSKLVFQFTGFQKGEKLVFSVDVDEIQDFDPNQTNQTIINEGIDPIASGVEFQGSQLQADFKAPHYFDSTGSGEFRNIYDPLFAGSTLLKSQGNANGLPNDDYQGKRDRSTGVMVQIQQIIKPASIRGRVHLSDEDCNCDTMESYNSGLEGVKITLKDANGNIVGTTFTDQNGDYAFDNLLPGVYTIVEETPPGLLDGEDHVGTINGIHVGQLGGNDIVTQIVLNGGDHGVHYDFCEHLPAQISGYVYHDADNDGVRDSAEAPIPGTTVILFDAGGTQIAQTTTDSTGFYRFTNLLASNYSVHEIQPTGWLDGKDTVGTINGVQVGTKENDKLKQIQLHAGESGIEYNFGELKPGSIAGRVWHDPDEDCIFDSGDAPLAGVTVQLLDANGNVLRTTTTDAQGQYRFDDLTPGVYAVRELQPAGYLEGGQMVGSHGGVASLNLLSQVNLASGDHAINYDFCELLPISLAGFVWSDPNDNCIFETGEQPIAGVKIELLDANGNVVATTFTGSDGRYKFENLKAGIYTVRETQPTGYLDGGDIVGSHGGNAAQDDRLTDISLKSGDQAINYDFCEIPPARLSGYVFRDGPVIMTTDGQPPANLYSIRDGKLTPDDKRLPGITLELRHTLTGEPVLGEECLPGAYPPGPVRVTTNSAGYYEFDGLRAGNYSIFEVHPAGYIDSIDTEGTTSGLAVNINTLVSPLVVMRFAAQGVNFKFDAILQVPLAAGQHSQLNNFSEVQITRIFIPPPEEPPIEPPPEIILPQRQLQFLPPPQIFIPPPAPQLVTGGGGEWTWHLSVVDAGLPRVTKKGTRITDVVWRPAMWLEKTAWKAENLRGGQWLLPGKAPGDPPVLFGLPGAIPVVGDFNGDGHDEIGIFYKGEWFLDLNDNGQWDTEDLWAKLGSEADRPVVGDWDGDGKDDIGIYGPEWPGDPRHLEHEPGLPDPENQRVHKPDPKNVPPDPEKATDGERLMRLTAAGRERADLIDHVFRFGGPADVPLAGDWNGDGIRSVGVFRRGKWHFDMDGDGRWSDGDKTATFGEAGDIPVVGDFNGDGIEEIGIFRGGQWIIDTNGNHQIDDADQRINLGQAGDLPIAGDFDGDGIDEPALYRETAKEAPEKGE